MKRSVIDNKIDLVVVDNFCSEDECDQIVSIIKRKYVDSTITTGQSDFRKSKTSILDVNHPDIVKINKNICDAIDVLPSHGEPIQGIMYETGGFFKAHTDYFESNEIHMCGKGGNRLKSAHLFLTDTTDGDLRFPIIDKTIKVKKGRLVYWRNIKNGETMYHALNEDKIAGSEKCCLVKYTREYVFK